MKHKKGKIGTAIVYIILLLGVTILSYPFASNWISKKQGIEIAEEYLKMTNELPDEEIDKEWEKAVVYNEHLRGDPVKDPFIEGSGMVLPTNYMNVLNVEGVMAYVEIPSVNINLPIYHGVSEDVLKNGVGHIESSSLPIGGFGSHSILTGHTGLPSAELFTDLRDLEEGDMFYIHVLGELLVYEIDKIKVIVPEELSDLVRYEGKDYITLLTCTPYGINSHRLLVRGERVYYYNERVITFSREIIFKLLFIVFGVLSVIMIIARRLVEKKDNYNIGSSNTGDRSGDSTVTIYLSNKI
ncbi:MAG: class C sortase [Suipraeoptans sp.]